VFLTTLFVRRPTLVFVFLALIAVAGSIAWSTLVRQQYPNVSQPTVTVGVTYNGASPTVMRDSIVRPIEDQIAGAPDLQTLNSTIQGGQATISAIFTISSNVNTDLVNVQKAIQQSNRSLPSDLTAPTVKVRDPSESVVTTLSLTSSSLTASELSLITTGRVIPLFQQIPGVSFVTPGGSVTPAYEVTVDPRRLAAYRLTLTDVVNTVAAGNVRAPGGIVYAPNRETNVDIRGDVITPESILGLPISVPSSGVPSTTGIVGPINGSLGAVDPWTSASAVLRVGDIATVSAGYEPRRQYGSVNGINGLFLQIQKTSAASEVDASNNVLAALPRVRTQFPDINFNIINVQSKYSEQQLDSVMRTLLEGVVLTGIVMLFFLHSWRNAVVVLIAIPASLGVALFVMKMLGLTLDTISLLGMTIVVGILVDDSTVVLENIERHNEMGEPPMRAAITGRTEIGVAAIVITLVDVVVFLPISFIQSQIGHQLAEFAIVVVIATLTSLFVCFTITPSLAGNWALRSTWEPWWIIHKFTHGFDHVRNWYAHVVLPWGLQHKVIVIGVCLLSFVGAIALVPLGIVGEEFVPAQDRGEIFIQLQYPVGTPLAKTTEAVLAVERAIRTSPDIDADTAVAGAYAAPFGGFVTQGNAGQVHIWLRTDRRHSTDYWVAAFRTMARKAAPGTDPIVVPATGTGGGNAQPLDELVTDVTGGDPTSYASQVEKVLAGTPGARNIISSSQALEPQMDVIFDRAKAQALNVSIGTAATAARAAFGGAIATQFETADGLEQVQIIYPQQLQTNLSELANVPIRTNTGQIVHLGDFSHFQSDPVSPLITRVDRNTVIHLSANITADTSLSNVQSAFLKRVKALHLPSHILVRPRPLGQQDFMQQTLVGLGTSLILSIMLVFLLMVALYNSYRSPFIIMFSVPVAAVGALGALYLTHSTLNLFSLIGTILLVGIVTKNGILLVDYANTLRERGESKVKAIQESAFTRFRPIIMTSISVIAGNIPLALALEPGSSTRASLGIVVIGGITSSLLLTLVLVPVMYVLLAPEKFVPAHGAGQAPGSTGTGTADGNGAVHPGAAQPAHA
jgi:hydrophobic/amphiphilic exporter-1 (mainly G- bacteria), HAE1 family